MGNPEAARLLWAKAKQDEFFAEETDQPLDRAIIREQVRRLRAWVERQLAATGKKDHGGK
ncbi:MAG: hypothetical protein HY674_03900 [Chloroflexi bacterium]|nr:hypothetical protein [Chloroflexota bacterium]